MIDSKHMIYCDEKAQCCGVLGPVGMAVNDEGTPEPMLRIVYLDATMDTVPASTLMLRPGVEDTGENWASKKKQDTHDFALPDLGALFGLAIQKDDDDDDEPTP